jgi:hypothetical protein
MRFEDAIKAMREGKVCRWEYDKCEYRINHGDFEVKCGGWDSFGRQGRLATDFIPSGSGFDWHIVEPPLPLPRRFRAKLGGSGEAVAGAELPCGYACWTKDGGACSSYDIKIYLTDIEYIDPPCTD